MTLIHKCNGCRFCYNCMQGCCETSLPPIKESIEGDYIVKRCPNCNSIIERFPTLESLSKKNTLTK